MKKLALCAVLLAGRAFSQTIVVTSATYGPNLSPAPTGNATAQVAALCNGKQACSYAVWYYNFTDPAPGKAKQFSTTWTCNGVPFGTQAAPLYQGVEAGYGAVATLACVAPTPTPTPTNPGQITLIPGTGHRIRISTICTPPQTACQRDPWRTDSYMTNDTPGVSVTIQVVP